MHRRSRQTSLRPPTLRQFAAGITVALLIPASVHALAQVGVHPIAGLMAAAVAAAVAARLAFRRFAAAVARRLHGQYRAVQRPSLLPTRQDASRGSRWRRLEAARTSLVVPVTARKISRPERA